MKKTVKVKLAARKAIPARTKEYIKILCDLCSKPVVSSSYGRGGGKCWLCGRDICEKHTVREYGGDYATKYCTICHPLYMPAIRELENRQDTEKEALERKIKKLSLTPPKQEVDTNE